MRHIATFFVCMLFSVLAFAQGTVTITNPTEGQNIVQGTAFNLTADFTDLDVNVSYNGRFQIDGLSTLGNPNTQNLPANAASASLIWDSNTYAQLQNLVIGPHTIEVALVSTTGGSSEVDRASVNFNIVSSASNDPPVVSIIDPVDGEMFTEGDNVAVEVSASDPDGTVSQVELFYDGVSQGVDNTAPYTSTINNVTVGLHTLRAEATDNEGATSVSSIVEIDVSAVGTDPEILSFVTPTDGQNILQGASFDVTTSATNLNPAESYNSRILISSNGGSNFTTILPVRDAANGANSQTATWDYASTPELQNLPVGSHILRSRLTRVGDGVIKQEDITINITSTGSPGTSNATRDCEPIVTKGADLCANIQNQDPDQIVGFRWTGSTWIQIPVQIDEMAVLDIRTPYGDLSVNNCAQNGSATDGTIPFNKLFYCDVNTHVGADPNTGFDADDELVFMANDAGVQAPNGSNPANVNTSTRCEYRIDDPLASSLGYVYFYVQNGSLDQTAGVDYVDFDFQFFLNGATSGTVYDETDYLAQYTECASGAVENFENTTVSSAYYETKWSTAWANDVLINKLASSQVDILDGNEGTKTIDAMGLSVRHTGTYRTQRHTKPTIKDGCIRVIIVEMGTNSGIYNNLTYLMYECFIQYINDYNVHSLVGARDQINFFLDFASPMVGATHYNEFGQGGVAVNGTGNRDGLGASLPEWDLQSHPSAGSIVTLYDFTTENMTVGSQAQVGGASGVDIAFEFRYNDQTGNGAWAGTGDGNEYGSQGLTVYTSRCSDPRYPNDGCATDNVYQGNAVGYADWKVIREVWFFGPNEDIATAQEQRQFKENPLSLNLVSQAASNNSISITAPSNGAIFTEPANVAVAASASSTGGIREMRLFQNGIQFGSVVDNPNDDNDLSVNWTLQNLSAGSYILRAVATIDQDGTTIEDQVTITVQGAAPNVSFDNVIDGQTYPDNQPIVIQGSATDDGTIQYMELFVDGVSQGQDNSPPYQWTLTNQTPGTKNLQLIAVDNDGNSTTEDLSIMVAASNSEFKVVNQLLVENTKDILNVIPNGVYTTNIAGSNDRLIPANSLRVTDPKTGEETSLSSVLQNLVLLTLESPNGTIWYLKADNAGNLSLSTTP